MIFNVFGAHGFKSAITDVQKDFAHWNASDAKTTQHFFGKVKSGSRRRNGSALPGVNGLISQTVLSCINGILASYVGRRWRYANPFKNFEQIFTMFKSIKFYDAAS